MTKKETFVTIKGILNDAGVVDFNEFLDHEVELLSRKRSRSSKPTKTQIANEAVKAEIANVLTDEGKTVTEIVKAMDGEYTNQKISALLRQMVNGGTAVKETVKGKALFTVA